MFNIFKSNKCCNGGTEHKFQPRYDEKSYPIVTNIGPHYDSYDVERILNASRHNDSKYVKDVCVWCGKEIQR